MKTKNQKSASPKPQRRPSRRSPADPKVAANDPIREFKKLLEAVRLVVKDPQLGIDERKSVVSITHEEHRRKLVTLGGSRQSLIVRSPHLKLTEKGVYETSLKEREVRLKDATDEAVVEKAVALLKRAGIKGAKERKHA